MPMLLCISALHCVHDRDESLRARLICVQGNDHDTKIGVYSRPANTADLGERAFDLGRKGG
jgi:hypothetical protein